MTETEKERERETTSRRSFSIPQRSQQGDEEKKGGADVQDFRRKKAVLDKVRRAAILKKVCVFM